MAYRHMRIAPPKGDCTPLGGETQAAKHVSSRHTRDTEWVTAVVSPHLPIHHGLVLARTDDDLAFVRSFICLVTGTCVYATSTLVPKSIASLLNRHDYEHQRGDVLSSKDAEAYKLLQTGNFCLRGDYFLNMLDWFYVARIASWFRIRFLNRWNVVCVQSYAFFDSVEKCYKHKDCMRMPPSLMPAQSKKLYPPAC